jgi:hypothetical protein
VARRRGPRRRNFMGTGCGLGGRGCGSHRMGRLHSAVYMGLTWTTDVRFLRTGTKGPPSDFSFEFSVRSMCGFALERVAGYSSASTMNVDQVQSLQPGRAISK